MTCSNLLYCPGLFNVDPLSQDLATVPSPTGLLRRTARLRWLASWLLAALVLGWAAAHAAGQPPEIDFPESTLTIESKAGTFTFTVEMAVTPAQRARGLMYRRHLPAGHGMLFDFKRDRVARMWMRNTYIPLDMLFIKADGRISRIAVDTEPRSERVISSGTPVRAVLELAGGVTRLLGIRPGDRVIHALFSGS